MHIFDHDIALTPLGEGEYQGVISENWLINGNPNGGYLIALMAQAMLMQSGKKSTPIITANYIAKTAPGLAELHTGTIAESKTFNRYETRLYQEGRERVRALGTFADEMHECPIERYETARPRIAPLSECIAIPPIPKYTVYTNLDVRLDPVCAGWFSGKLADVSEHKGWISFRDERPFDLQAVLLAADAFPPPVFVSQGPAAWVPTIELSVNIRNLPRSKWLACFFRTRFVTCGLLEEDGEVWDEEGTLVAISRQIAQYRKLG